MLKIIVLFLCVITASYDVYPNSCVTQENKNIIFKRNLLSICNGQIDKYEAFVKVCDFSLKNHKIAMPILLEYLLDERESYYPGDVSKNNLGETCYYILINMLFNYGEGFASYTISKTNTRIGNDGKIYQRYLYNHHSTVKQRKWLQNWLKKRRYCSLEEIQIDYIKELINLENKIGYQNDYDKDKYLKPLKDNLKKLQSQKRIYNKNDGL